MSGFVQVWRMIVTRGTYLAKAVQGVSSRKPAVMDTHGRGGEGVLPLQQHPQVAPGQSWGPGERRLRESQVGKGRAGRGQHHPGVSPGRTRWGAGAEIMGPPREKEKQRRAEGTCE